MTNEKAIRARIPVNATSGIEIQYDESPLKTKSPTLKPGTTKVIKYRATAYPTHLKSPKVIRFRGKRSTLMTGLITKEARVRATPVNIIVFVPFSKTIPETAIETRYKVTEFTRKYLIARLIITLV